MQYILAGASLVQIGTASFADPRTAARVSSGLRSYAESLRVAEFRELVGCGSIDAPPPVSRE